jgi:hypothetical protein
MGLLLKRKGLERLWGNNRRGLRTEEHEENLSAKEPEC